MTEVWVQVSVLGREHWGTVDLGHMLAITAYEDLLDPTSCMSFTESRPVEPWPA